MHFKTLRAAMGGTAFAMAVATGGLFIGTAATPLMSKAWAQHSDSDHHSDSEHSKGKKGSPQQKRSGQSGERTGEGRSGKRSDTIYRGGKRSDTTRDATGAPRGPGTTGPKGKGSLFGDLFIVKRDATGTVVTSVEGSVTYVWLLNKSGEWVKIPLDEKNKYEIPEDIKDTLVEVELARLNVARSPKISEVRYKDLLNIFTNATAVTTDLSGRLVITYKDSEGNIVTKTIDSPVDALVIYTKLMTEGYLPGLSAAVLPDNLKDLATAGITATDVMVAASLFATANDKYIKILPDAVVYLNRILSIPTNTTLPTLSDFSGTYVNYDTSTLNFTYDRTVYDVYVKIRVISDGSEQVVKLSDMLGGSITTLTGFAAFVQATDDARAVISYLHDNPVLEVCGATAC